MYLHNKYTNWYYNIITNAKSRVVSPDTYTERHHVIPKSLGGLNSKDNLVRLTAREHFICHWLLTKMTLGQDQTKMIFALHRMNSSSNKQQRYSNLSTTRVYEKNRIEHSKRISAMNSGRIQSEETKQKIRESMLGKNKGLIRSDETKQKLSLAKLGKTRVVTENHKQNLSVALKGKNLGKVRTDEQKQNTSLAISNWWKTKKSQ